MAEVTGLKLRPPPGQRSIDGWFHEEAWQRIEVVPSSPAAAAGARRVVPSYNFV